MIEMMIENKVAPSAPKKPILMQVPAPMVTLLVVGVDY